MQSYIVLEGDTLYGISKQFGVSIEEIIKQNNIVDNLIYPGEALIIPSKATTILYTVKKGDTLYSISKKYNVNIMDIKRLNNLNSDNLSIGSNLFIPINDTDSFNYYTVLPNDTLYSISNKFNTTVDSLKKLNYLNSNILSIGQQLKVPEVSNNNDELIYIVKSGDTLYSISKKYGVSVDTIKSINNLTSNDLYIGEKLIINNIYNSNISLGSSCFGDGYVEVKYLNYIVKKGDNLYNISKKYGVSVDSIMKLNNLTSSSLSIGQILKIKEI